MTSIDHRCQAGKRCAALTEEGPAITPKPLCEACIETIETKRARLPALKEMLDLFKGGGLRTNAEARVSRSSERQQPLNLVVYDLIGQIEDSALWNGIPTDELDPTVAVEFGTLHDRAESLLGLQPVWHQRLAPCGKCGERALGNWTGSELVQCSNCAMVITRDAYDRSCRYESEQKEQHG